MQQKVKLIKKTKMKPYADSPEELQGRDACMLAASRTIFFEKHANFHAVCHFVN